jgi:hypothetical protein
MMYGKEYQAVNEPFLLENLKDGFNKLCIEKIIGPQEQLLKRRIE